MIVKALRRIHLGLGNIFIEAIDRFSTAAKMPPSRSGCGPRCSTAKWDLWVTFAGVL